MALTLFDLDNTLLDGDSDYRWGQFLVSKKLVNEKEYNAANKYFMKEYKQGTLDIIEYSAFNCKPLSIRSMQELNKLHQEFMQEIIIPLVRPKANTLIEKHRTQGDTLMIITATNSFISTPIADYFGIENLLATNPKIVDGKYTTEIEGTPCFQEGKVIRLNQWLQGRDETFKGSTFYSDSFNDIHLLEVVDTPVVVDPDDKLRQVAVERGWDVMSLMGSL